MKISYYFFPFLIYGIFYFYFGELVPENNGFGWDGVIYADITQNLYNLIESNDLSRYYAKRVFPPFLINSIFTFFNIDFTVKNIVNAYIIFNISSILIAIIIYLKICNFCKFSLNVTLFGYVSLFINFLVLKQIFFVPVGVDASTLPICLLFIYSLLKKSRNLLFLTTLIGSFIWQINVYYGILLLLFFNPFLVFNSNETVIDKYLLKKIVFYLSCFCIAFLSFYVYMKYEIINLFSNFNLYSLSQLLKNTQFGHKIINADFLYTKIGQLFTGFPSLVIISFLIFYYFLNIKNKLLSKNFKYNFDIINFIYSITLFIVINLILYFISNDKIRGGNSFLYLINWIIFPMGNIGTLFMPFITEFLLLGPCIIIIIVLYDKIFSELSKVSCGLLLVALLSLPLILATEPRYIIQIWPVYVFGLCLYLNQIKISNKFLLVFLFLSFLNSRVYVNIIKEPWVGDPHSVPLLYEFPRQEFFKVYGPWMNFESYLFGLSLFIVSFLFLYFTLKNRINFYE